MRIGKIIMAAAALALAACNPWAGSNLTDAAVEAFHKRFNYRLFSEIYLESDNALRRATEYRDFLEGITNLERAMGQVVSSERKDIRFEKSQSGGADKAFVVMDTQFEYGKADESFVFSLGREVQLVAYSYEITHHDQAKREEARAELMRQQMERMREAAPRPTRRAEPLSEEEIRNLPPEIRRALREAGAI